MYIKYIVMILLLCAFIMPSGAVTIIPAGTVNNYVCNVPGETYILGGNVSSTGIAITISANNVTLDGNGYTIFNANTTSGSAIAASSKTGIHIKNVYTEHTNSGISNSFGIYLNAVTHSYIDNVYAKSTSVPINLVNSDYNQITNCTGESLSTSSAISISTGSDYNNLMHFHAISASGTGLSIKASHNTANYGTLMPYTNGILLDTATYCNISNIEISSAQYGIYLTSSNYNYIENISAGTTSNNGIYFLSSSNNTVNNITTNTSTAKGIYIPANSNHNILTNSSFHSGSGAGAQVEGIYNTINTSTISSSASYAISVGADNNTIANNTIIAIVNYGLYLNHADNSSIYNNNISSNSSYGSYVIYSENNIFRNNIFFSDTSNGIYITFNSSNNNFDGDIFHSNAKHSVRLIDSSNNIFGTMTCISPVDNSPYNQNEILLIGDSITAGGSAYVQLGAWGLDVLNRMGSDWHISNQGYPGFETDEILFSYSGILDIYDPNHVLIMLGTNDIIYDDIPESNSIDNIMEMANYSRSVGTEPYVLTIIPKISHNNRIIGINSNLTTRAHALGYTVINVYDSIDLIPRNGQFDGYNDTNYQPDGVHPNEIGNTMIGDYIYDAIAIDNELNILNINISNTSTLQTVNVTHIPSATLNNYTIQHTSLGVYDGNITFSSTNPNATLYRNETGIVIYTGYIMSGQSYSYTMSILSTYNSTNHVNVISDVHNTTIQTVNISHVVNVQIPNTTISYQLLPAYSGTPVLASTNPNATISRNDTHVIITTGYIKSGQTVEYNITVANNHIHPLFKNTPMRWNGNGLDFVGVAPDDWDDYIGDEIEVTVS